MDAMENKDCVATSEDSACWTVGNVELPYTAPRELTANTREGLADTFWPGRCQTVSLANEHRKNVSLFLDGAHTFESMQVCVDWFTSVTHVERTRDTPLRVLLFNCKSTKEPVRLMMPLLDVQRSAPFDIVVFSTNRIGEKDEDDEEDLSEEARERRDYRRQKALDWQEKQFRVWQVLCNNLEAEQVEGDAQLPEKVICQPTITSALEWIKEGVVRGCKQRDVHVLVTGSLYLVGGVLAALEAEVR